MALRKGKKKEEEKPKRDMLLAGQKIETSLIGRCKDYEDIPHDSNKGKMLRNGERDGWKQREQI